MDLMAQLESKKSIMIKGLFDPFVINTCPNLEYLSDPLIDNQLQIQNLLAKRSARILTKVVNGSTSAAILMMNDLLEEKRLKETPDLITSFYTIQEFAPWAHVTLHLVGGNLELISKHAKYLTDSWFPESFIQVLGKLLNYYSKELRSDDCLNIYRILYFAVKKSIRLNINPIMDSCKRVFMQDSTIIRTKNLADVLLLLLAIHSKCFLNLNIDSLVDKDSKSSVFNLILQVLRIDSGNLLSESLESLGLLQMELLLVLQNIQSNDWKRLTISIIKSFKDESFDTYISLIQIYKRYSDFVLYHRDSRWIVSQLLFQDWVIDSFVKNCEWIYDYINKKHTQGTLLLFKIR